MAYYKFKVLNMDGVPDDSGDSFLPEGVTLPVGKVPVCMNYVEEFGGLCGYGVVSVEGDALYVDLKTDSVLVGLTPGVGGKVTDRRNGTVCCKITNIGIFGHKNQDKRIGPIGPPT